MDAKALHQGRPGLLLASRSFIVVLQSRLAPPGSGRFSFAIFMKLGDAPGVHVKRTRIDMKILVTVILSIVGALLALAQGDSESTAGEAATPLEGLLDRGTLSERFQVIVDRNPFNLQPPPLRLPPKSRKNPKKKKSRSRN